MLILKKRDFAATFLRHLIGTVRPTDRGGHHGNPHIWAQRPQTHPQRTLSAGISAPNKPTSLYFDEILLSDIIKELERSYDVKITVADDTLNTIRFYGNFRKREQSIQEIMNVLSSTDKMTYTMNGKNIVITLPK